MTKQMHVNTCPTEQLILFHFAELDEVDCRQIEQHLQGCPACHAELASLREVLAQVPSADPELTAGELHNFSARVMKNLPQRRHISPPVLGWALAGAVVLMLTLNLWPQLETSLPAPASTPIPMMAELEVVDQLDLLQNLDLLENLDLLQQLANQG